MVESKDMYIGRVSLAAGIPRRVEVVMRKNVALECQMKALASNDGRV